MMIYGYCCMFTQNSTDSFVLVEKCDISEEKIDKDNLVDTILQEFSDSLRFDPNIEKMAYVVRDPVINREFCFTLF